MILAPVSRQSATYTTNAVAGTLQNEALLVAAPGVGLRLRILWVSLSTDPANAGRIRAYLKSSTGLFFWAQFGLSQQQPSDRMDFGAQGFELGDNVGIGIRDDSSAISQPFDVAIGYITETT